MVTKLRIGGSTEIDQRRNDSDETNVVMYVGEENGLQEIDDCNYEEADKVEDRGRTISRVSFRCVHQLMPVRRR